MSCPSPPSRKAPGLPFLSGFPGVFLFSRVDCPPRRAAADVRPPAAPVHKKRRRPPSTPSRSMNVRMCGPFPPEICSFPLKNGGFPTLPPVLPVYPGFSIILSPYRILWRVGGRHIVDRPSIRQRGGRADRNHAGRGIARYASADCRQHPRTSQADRAGPSGRDSAAGPGAGRRMTSSRLLFFRFPAVLHISLFLPQS